MTDVYAEHVSWLQALRGRVRAQKSRLNEAAMLPNPDDLALPRLTEIELSITAEIRRFNEWHQKNRCADIIFDVAFGDTSRADTGRSPSDRAVSSTWSTVLSKVQQVLGTAAEPGEFDPVFATPKPVERPRPITPTSVDCRRCHFMKHNWAIRSGCKCKDVHHHCCNIVTERATCAWANDLGSHLGETVDHSECVAGWHFFKNDDDECPCGCEKLAAAKNPVNTRPANESAGKLNVAFVG